MFPVGTNYTCEDRQKFIQNRLNHAKCQCKVSAQTILYIHTKSTTNLLGVLASIRVLSLLNTSSNTSAVLVAGRVSNTSRSPDAPGTVDAVGAGDQVTAAELEVVLVVDGPAGALRVLGGGLGAGGVADFSLACMYSISIRWLLNIIEWVLELWNELTHTRSVNIELLGRSRLVIEIESTILNVESSRLLLRTSAAGVLGRKTSEEAALGGVETGVLHSAAGVDGDDAEGLLAGVFSLGGGKSRDGGGGRGGEDEILELHFDGVVF